MTQAVNPYAPPRASLEADAAVDVWRDGKILVMRHGGTLPHRCVKCNQPAEPLPKPVTIYWHHPAIYLLILVNALIYIIVGVIARKKARLTLALCEHHRKKRSAAIMTGWGGALLGVAAAGAGMAAGQTALIPIGIALGVLSLLVGVIRSRVVSAKRIDKEMVRLRGCGESFLAALPEYH